jgi:hypothetical protein
MSRFKKTTFWTLAVLSALLLASVPATAQEPEEAAEPSIVDSAATVEVTPASLTLDVGEKAKLEAVVKDAEGNVIQAPVIFISRARRNLGVQASGDVEAYRPGEYTIVAIVPQGEDFNPRNPNQEGVRAEIAVTIPQPPLDRIIMSGLSATMFEGTTLRTKADVYDTTDVIRRDLTPTLATSDSSVATVDRFGQVKANRTGTFKLIASIESVTEEMTVDVVTNPIRSLELDPSETEARTGDVILMGGVAKDASGNPIEGYPIRYAVQAHEVDANPGAAARAQILDDGRFVAEEPGLYTVMALAGDLSATTTVEITPREVRRTVEVLGRGPVIDRHTSDLWVWEGVDGRDYAITGTWGAAGHAYFWDVTDPSAISLIDTVRVDARTVNDVKVSEDGKFCVISREGASNRKNGLVILDVSDPQNGIEVIARYDDQLTGGVHNVFVAEEHIYALSAGRRYDILNAEDPKNPYRVGRFEMDTPGHSIHDVWVHEGIAYSSNWNDGVVAVDVGGGGKGGSPNNPVLLGNTPYPSGWNHAAYPYRSKSTGKFLMIGGDEAFPYQTIGEANTPDRAAGWIHIFEWDEWEEAREVARYQVPEAGTHNLWVEDDILYEAYYEGGLRMVDLSGDLMGNLYTQGREISVFKAHDPLGYIPNAPAAWGVMPWKGNVFFADINSGLWSVKILPKDRPVS